MGRPPLNVKPTVVRLSPRVMARIRVVARIVCSKSPYIRAGRGIGSSNARDQGISPSAGLEQPLCRQTFAPPAARAFLSASAISSDGLRCRRRGIAGRSTRRLIGLRRIRGAQLSSRSAIMRLEGFHFGTQKAWRLSFLTAQNAACSFNALIAASQRSELENSCIETTGPAA
jgi:hypothetical protein